MKKDWVWRRGDSSFGPVTAAELKQLASTGILQPTDLVSRVGIEKWVAASRVQGLIFRPECKGNPTSPNRSPPPVTLPESGARSPGARTRPASSAQQTSLRSSPSPAPVQSQQASPTGAPPTTPAQSKGLPLWLYAFAGVASLILVGLGAWIAGEAVRSSHRRAVAKANDTCREAVALARAACAARDWTTAERHLAEAVAINAPDHQGDVLAVRIEIDAKRGLAEADSLIATHQLEAAQRRLKDIREAHPGTPSAALATALLDQIEIISAPDRLNALISTISEDETAELLESGELPARARLANTTLHGILVQKCRELVARNRQALAQDRSDKGEQEGTRPQPAGLASAESLPKPEFRHGEFATPASDTRLLSQSGSVVAGDDEWLTYPKQVTIARLLRQFADRTRKHPFYGVHFARSGGLPTEIPTVGTHSIEANQEAGNARAAAGPGSLDEARWVAWSNVFGSLYHGTPEQERGNPANNTNYLKRMGFDLRDSAFPYTLDGRSNTVPAGCKPFSPIDFQQDFRAFEAEQTKEPQYFKVWNQHNVNDVFESLIVREIGALRCKVTTLQLQDRLKAGLRRLLPEIEFGNVEVPGLSGRTLPIDSFEQIAELASTPVSSATAGAVFPSWQTRQSLLSIVRDYYEKATDASGQRIYPDRMIDALARDKVDPASLELLDLQKIKDLLSAREYEKALVIFEEVVSSNSEWAAKRKATMINVREYFVTLDMVVNSTDDYGAIYTKSMLMSASVAPFLRGIFRDAGEEVVERETGRKLEEWIQRIDALHQKSTARSLFDHVSPRVVIDYALLTGNTCPLPSAELILQKLLARVALLNANPDALRKEEGSTSSESSGRFL